MNKFKRTFEIYSVTIMSMIKIYVDLIHIHQILRTTNVSSTIRIEDF